MTFFPSQLYVITPQIMVEKQIELHSPRIFESGGELDESEVDLVAGVVIE